MSTPDAWESGAGAYVHLHRLMTEGTPVSFESPTLAEAVSLTLIMFTRFTAQSGHTQAEQLEVFRTFFRNERERPSGTSPESVAQAERAFGVLVSYVDDGEAAMVAAARSAPELDLVEGMAFLWTLMIAVNAANQDRRLGEELLAVQAYINARGRS